MSKWEKVRLRDVFPMIRNGASIKQSANAYGLPITRIESISNGVLDRDRLGYANILDNKYSNFYLKDGDILMSHINSEKHLGKCALYVKTGDEVIIHGMNLLCLRTEQYIPAFAKYFFESSAFKRQIPAITKKSVNQASFTVTALKELTAPLPPLAEQQKIADILDKVSHLIALRKEQLNKMDLLAKAKFVEMFGDPVENPMGWEKVELAETTKVITGNTPPRSEKSNYGNYIEWIKTDNITENLYLTEATESLSEIGYAKGRIVKENTILMACIAGSIKSIGRVAIANREVAFNQQINAIVPVQYETLFLYWLFRQTQGYIQSTINMSLKGILSKGKLEELEFILPPLALQTQFADYVTQVETSKKQIQQGLEKLEVLYRGLMQEYFE